MIDPVGAKWQEGRLWHLSDLSSTPHSPDALQDLDKLLGLSEPWFHCLWYGSHVTPSWVVGRTDQDKQLESRYWCSVIVFSFLVHSPGLCPWRKVEAPSSILSGSCPPPPRAPWSWLCLECPGFTTESQKHLCHSMSDGHVCSIHYHDPAWCKVL